MAQPPQLNQTLEIWRGDTKEWSFAVLDEHGAAVNITGATAKFTVKHSLADADGAAVFQKTESSGITIDAGTGGTGSVKVSPADTSAQVDARVVLIWDLQVIVGGNTYTPAAGELLVWPSVTKS